jgi:adenylate cyclase
MAEEGVQRRLAAILAADVAGYSRLMGADEEGTLKTLTLYRGVITQFVEEHQGRVVDAVGDSLLAEFGSAVQAVRSAVAIQRALDRRNADLEEARRMHFRIGINVGDVMVQGADLLGDGVNIAARLEQLAKPGSIFVSGTVWEQIEGKLSFPCAYVGEQAMKNIARPVRTSYGQKIETVERRRRSLARWRWLQLFAAINRESVGVEDEWIGRASWPSSRGWWTRSCWRGMNIWPPKIGS